MTATLIWQPNESSSQVIRHLVEGRCVALPTESTYEVVASGLHPQAIEQLPATGVAAIVISDYAELFDWMPRLRGSGARLFRKLGPGPVVLRANGGHATGLCERLPAAAQSVVVREGLLGARWPGHAIWSELRQAGVPLVSVALPGAVDVHSTAAILGDQVACIVDGGHAQHVEGPTVVRAEARRCLVERPGALPQELIDELTMCRALFICTGNTCRSPMAEVLCGKLLADALGVSPAELSKHGFYLQSAGLAAMKGGAASPNAVTIAADHGANLSQHRSQLLTMEMLLWADHVFGVTSGHCYTLESILPDGMPAPRLLSPDLEDIADPIGGALADYRICAAQILACLHARLPELLES